MRLLYQVRVFSQLGEPFSLALASTPASVWLSIAALGPDSVRLDRWRFPWTFLFWFFINLEHTFSALYVCWLAVGVNIVAAGRGRVVIIAHIFVLDMLLYVHSLLVRSRGGGVTLRIFKICVLSPRHFWSQGLERLSRLWMADWLVLQRHVRERWLDSHRCIMLLRDGLEAELNLLLGRCAIRDLESIGICVKFWLLLRVSVKTPNLCVSVRLVEIGSTYLIQLGWGDMVVVLHTHCLQLSRSLLVFSHAVHLSNFGCLSDEQLSPAV